MSFISDIRLVGITRTQKKRVIMKGLLDPKKIFGTAVAVVVGIALAKLFGVESKTPTLL